MSFSDRIYRRLLALYPADHRREYSGLMAQHFRDQYRDACRRHPITGPVWLWLHILPDFVTSLVSEHRAARKVKPMRTIPSWAGILTALIGLLPSLAALLLLFDPKVLRGEWIPYGMAALIGAGGYLLARIGLIPRLKFWGSYTAGFLIFSFGFLAINIWSPSMNLGIAALSNGSIVNFRHALHIIAGLAAIVLLYRSSKDILTPFRMAVVVLVLNLVMWIVLNNAPLDAPVIWTAAGMLGYTATTLFVAIVGMRLTRRAGILSLVAVTAGLGLQLTLFTIDEYRGTELTLMILLGAFVPLIVCPAWLLLTQNWRVQKYGLLVIWTLMMVGLFAVPQLLWRPGHPLAVNVILYHIGNCLPVWLGLWLALNIYERQTPLVESNTGKSLAAVTAPL